MFCEHPTCKLEANTICKYHCHLSVCQQHRFEHENKLLNEFEKQLDDLSKPISTLLNQSQIKLKQSEESRQKELERIHSLINRHRSTIDQRLKLAKTTKELIVNKREQLLQYKNGDYQLKKDDYQQIQRLATQIQTNLQQQCQLNTQIHDEHSQIQSWPIEKENPPSTDVECIVISDSEEESTEPSTDIVNMDQEIFSSNDNNHQIEVGKKSKINLALLRDYCPLTEIGVFGLQTSHNLSRLCSKDNNTRRCLYRHFTHYHVIKSSIAYQLVKAIRDGLNSMQTKIFPQDNFSICLENIQCPLDQTAMKFNQHHMIPGTPCYSSIAYPYFRNHLRTVHSITKTNADLIFYAMKDHGTISHVQFEEDLCEME